MDEDLKRQIEAAKQELANDLSSSRAYLAAQPLPATPSATSVPSSSRKTLKLPQSVRLSLVIFLLSTAVVLVGFPNLYRTSAASPSFMLFVTMGLIMIAFTSLLFWYLGKLKLGFGKTALMLAFGYNVVIGIIKLVIAPYALYLSNQNGAFVTQLNDPNTQLYYIFVAVVILILYAVVLRLIYHHFAARMAGARHKSVHKWLKGRTVRTYVFIVLGILAVAALGGIASIFLAFILFAQSVNYLGYVFGSAIGVPLIAAVVLAAVLAYFSFDAVAEQAIITGNTTLLASFFWLGLSLIVLYHIMWIILMITLVNIWPFNTYTPK